MQGCRKEGMFASKRAYLNLCMICMYHHDTYLHLEAKIGALLCIYVYAKKV